MYIKIVLPFLIVVVVWDGVGGAGHDEGQGGQEENGHRKHLIEGSGESGFHGVFIHPHTTVTPSSNTFSYSPLVIHSRPDCCLGLSKLSISISMPRIFQILKRFKDTLNFKAF